MRSSLRSQLCVKLLLESRLSLQARSALKHALYPPLPLVRVLRPIDVCIASHRIAVQCIVHVLELHSLRRGRRSLTCDV